MTIYFGVKLYWIQSQALSPYCVAWIRYLTSLKIRFPKCETRKYYPPHRAVVRSKLNNVDVHCLAHKTTQILILLKKAYMGKARSDIPV